jgi:hypothetical protein
MAESLGTDPGTGRIGYGSTLQGSATGVIGMITKITIDGIEAADIDVTTMNSPGRFMQFITGLKDPKNMTLELIYESINMGILINAVGNPNETWTVKFPDSSTYAQAGHIKSVGAAIPYNDKITQPVTLRMSGAPTWTAGSA